MEGLPRYELKRRHMWKFRLNLKDKVGTRRRFHKGVAGNFDAK